MIDIVREIEAVQREVGDGRIPAGEGRTVALQRDYDAPIEDVWDALTNPERIGRWFLPISGDYRLGGRYQFEGNAGGEIVACERPNRLKVTWVVRRGGQRAPTSRRSRSGCRPSTAGRHGSSSSTPRSCRTDRGAEYGPGAVGVGWDRGCSGSRCTSAADRSTIRRRGSCRPRGGSSTPEQRGLGRGEPGRGRRAEAVARGGREHDGVLRTGSGRSGVVDPGRLDRQPVGGARRRRRPSAASTGWSRSTPSTMRMNATPNGMPRATGQGRRGRSRPAGTGPARSPDLFLPAAHGDGRAAGRAQVAHPVDLAPRGPDPAPARDVDDRQRRGARQAALAAANGDEPVEAHRNASGQQELGDRAEERDPPRRHVRRCATFDPVILRGSFADRSVRGTHTGDPQEGADVTAA